MSYCLFCHWLLSIAADWSHHFIFVGAFWHRDRQHTSIKMIKCIWTPAGFYFESAKMKKTLHCTWGYLQPSLFSLPSVHMDAYPSFISLYLYLCFFPSWLLCFSALFAGVLEKTVEGEAAALNKAKTLYKSCTNESASAGIRCQHRLFLFVSSIVLKWTFFLLSSKVVSHSVCCVVKLSLKTVITTLINYSF